MVGRQFIESFGHQESNYITPVPPSYFKIGELVNVDHEEKFVRISVSKKFPVANIGDGVSVNVTATWVL